MSRRRDLRRKRDYARIRMRDMARSRRKGGRDYGSIDYNYNDYPEHYVRYDYALPSHEYARRSRDYESGWEYDRHYAYPEEMSPMRRRMYSGSDYNYDYARRTRRDYGSEESEYLSDDELMEWSKEMYQDVEQKDKPFFTKENIEHIAADMGIKFDKFTFEEFYTTALMMYTDYCETLGTGNMAIYLKLAKDWLCDEDVEVQYGEKLAAYHDYIVMDD